MVLTAPLVERNACVREWGIEAVLRLCDSFEQALTNEEHECDNAEHLHVLFLTIVPLAAQALRPSVIIAVTRTVSVSDHICDMGGDIAMYLTTLQVMSGAYPFCVAYQLLCI